MRRVPRVGIISRRCRVRDVRRRNRVSVRLGTDSCHHRWRQTTGGAVPVEHVPDDTQIHHLNQGLPESVARWSIEPSQGWKVVLPRLSPRSAGVPQEHPTRGRSPVRADSCRGDSEGLCELADVSGVFDLPAAVPAGADSGIDYRMIVFSKFNSTDSPCLLLDRWDQPISTVAPVGWPEHLRVGAYKVFVEITDDGVSCGSFNDPSSDPNDAVRSAQAFDAALRDLSRDHFGVQLQRTYSWFSIVGMQENVPPEEPWPAVVDGEAAKVQTGLCASACAPGARLSGLSIASGSLRWPVFRNDDFSAMFRAIATNVVQKASVSCD